MKLRACASSRPMATCDEHADEALGREHLLALEDEAELLAVEELHDQEPRRRDHVALEVEHLDDVLVRQERADLVLALEALERDLVLRDVLVEHLHRDARVGLLVDPLVDAAHAAVGDHAADLVAPAEARPDARVVRRRRDRRHARRR